MTKRTYTRRLAVLLALLLSGLLLHADQRCVTTANLNLRVAPSTNSRRVVTVPQGSELTVVGDCEGDWCRVAWQTDTLYASRSYLKVVEPPPAPRRHPVRNLFRIAFKVTFILLAIYVGFLILRLLFWLFMGLFSFIGYKGILVFSVPFYLLNLLQRWLSKPWRPFLKDNVRDDARAARLRKVLPIVQVPFYLLLTPLRFLNAVYYNLLVHNAFEVVNYCAEIAIPHKEQEGADSILLWVAMLPWRIIKYLLWHETLTLVESCIWTVVDTFVPALTLYHGTTPEASESITQSRGRVGNSDWTTEVWNVGGGNFAGNGIYFAPARSTAMHYSSGSLIICRVSLGRVIDLGIAPLRVFNQCGHPNAYAATEWGLNNHFVTGEWWRSDGARWWEYCMYDWQNRYNHSWRIRPLYVLHTDSERLQCIPGGTYHWLFRRMAWQDLLCDLRHGKLR